MRKIVFLRIRHNLNPIHLRLQMERCHFLASLLLEKTNVQELIGNTASLIAFCSVLLFRLAFRQLVCAEDVFG